MEPVRPLVRLHCIVTKAPVRIALLLLFALAVQSCTWADSEASPEGNLVAAGPAPDALETGDPSPTAQPSPTAPAEPFRFVAIGDFGTGEPDQQRVADRMCALRQRSPFDLVVTTGDNVYDSGEPEDFGPKFFEPYDCLLSEGVQFRSSLGNHDILTDNGRPELEEPAFGMEARNYVVRQGGVRFVIVNSNSLRLEWLRQALNTQAGDAWTVVAMHHPVFSGGDEHGATPGFADKLAGLFARKGVDLVLTGHDHVYSVTQEVRGVRYVVTGGGGARGYGCKETPKVTTCIPRLHFVSVTVGPTDLTVKAIPPSGPPLHRFTTNGI